MGSRLILAICLLASTGTAQDPWPTSWTVQVLDLDADSGVQLLPEDRPDGVIAQLSWTPPDSGGESVNVPFVRPVRSCDVAITRDGNGLIVLAGGIRDSLDLYLVDRQRAGFYVLETSGGRRLPSSFNHGLGSWPLAEGPHVVLFAFEKDGRLEFRALDFQGRIHASRNLPLEVTGLTADADLGSSELRIRFLPEGEELMFHHPLAPRLILGQGLLEFGTPPVGREVFREAELRNGGERPLEVILSAEGASFRIDGESNLIVEPGEVAMVRVGFKPQLGGATEGHLVFRANSPNPDAEITLRGQGLDLDVEEEPEQPVPAPTTPQLSMPPDPEVIRDAAPEPFLPTRPDVGALEITPLPTEQMRITGFLRAPAPGTTAVELQAGTRRHRAPLGPGHAFSLTVQAQPGQWLRLAAVGHEGALSPTTDLAQVLPTLQLVGDDLEIRTQPSRPFLLAAVVLDTDGHRVQRVLAAWKGRSDPQGLATVDLDRIGPRRVPLHLLVFVDDPQISRRSNLLRLEPDS